jgi:hypothetical protein
MNETTHDVAVTQRYSEPFREHKPVTGATTYDTAAKQFVQPYQEPGAKPLSPSEVALEKLESKIDAAFESMRIAIRKAVSESLAGTSTNSGSGPSQVS